MKRQMQIWRKTLQYTAVLVVCATTQQTASAQMNSTNYAIGADVFASGGGASQSETYQLTDTVAETVIAEGNSANYMLKDGFWHAVNTYLNVSTDTSTVNFGALTPGVAQTAQNDVTVATDAWNGYRVLIEKDHAMRHTTQASSTIPDFTGTIASPATWSTQNGMGVTLASATGMAAKWRSGGQKTYAAVPGSATEIHQKTAYDPADDTTTFEYKVNVSTSQRSGTYDADVTYTIIPSL